MTRTLTACLIAAAIFSLEMRANAQVVEWEHSTAPDILLHIEVCRDERGGYIATGRVLKTDAGSDICLVRFSPEGEVLWDRTFGNADLEGRTSLDAGYDVKQTRDGGFLVVGTDHDQNNFKVLYVLKTNSEGLQEWHWQSSYGRYSIQWQPRGVEASDGRIIVAANVLDDYSGFVVWILSIQPPSLPGTSPVVWRTYIPPGANGVYDREVRDLLETGDGNFMLAGKGTSAPGYVFPDMWVAKYAITPTSISAQWERLYGTDGLDSATCISPALDGGFAVAGMIDIGAQYHDYRAAFLRINQDGLMGGNGVQMQRGTWVRDMVLEEDGGYLMSSDEYLIRADPAGREQWWGKLPTALFNSMQRTGGSYVGVGNKNATPSIVKFALNTPPVAEAGPSRLVNTTTGNTATVTLDGSGSSDADGDLLTYVWSENDVILGTGSVVSVSLALGQHFIVLTVTDSKGSTSTDWLWVTVNAVPVAVAGPDQTVQATTADGWATVTLDGTGSYDLDQEPLSYLWSEAGGTLGNEAVTTTSLQLGTHEIMLTVRDGKGAASADTLLINVVATPEGVAALWDEVVATSGVSDQEAAYLNDLLKDAALALQEGDVDTADHKLDQFKDQIDRLRDRGELSPTDADTLIGAADATINALR